MRKLGKMAAVAGLLSVAGVARPAHASLALTLQNLIDDGATGITIGDKQFYNFGYQSTGTDTPTASEIFIGAPSSGQEGLRFISTWNSASGLNEDSTITYSVHVLDSVPQNLISAVGLGFQGTATGGTLDAATVTEQVKTLDGTPVGTFSVIDFGPGDPRDVDLNSLTLNPPLRDISVSKDINVHSAATSTPGTSSITFVDNTFTQTPVPEPASLALAGAALGLIARRRRA